MEELFSFQIAGPFIAYMLFLALLHLRKTPTVMTGRLDFFLLALGLSGFFMAWLAPAVIPVQALVNYGSLAWGLMFVLYILVVNLISTVFSQKIVIYNLESISVVRALLEAGERATGVRDSPKGSQGNQRGASDCGKILDLPEPSPEDKVPGADEEPEGSSKSSSVETGQGVLREAMLQMAMVPALGAVWHIMAFPAMRNTVLVSQGRKLDKKAWEAALTGIKKVTRNAKTGAGWIAALFLCIAIALSVAVMMV